MASFTFSPVKKLVVYQIPDLRGLVAPNKGGVSKSLRSVRWELSLPLLVSSATSAAIASTTMQMRRRRLTPVSIVVLLDLIMSFSFHLNKRELGRKIQDRSHKDLCDTSPGG